MSHKIEEFYTSGEYLKYNPSWGREDSDWKVKQICKLIPEAFLKHNFNDKEIRIADIGCGAGGVIGGIAGIFRQKGYRVNAAGFDISEEPLNIAREQWQGMRFIKGNVFECKNFFDIGLLIDLIEHVESPDQFVQQCGRYCKYIVFHVPLDNNLNFKLRNRYEYLKKTFGHINYWNSDSLIKFLSENKMRILKYRYTPNFMLPSSRTHLPAKVGFMPRLALSFISKRICAKLLGGYNLTVLAESLIYENEA